MELSDNSRKDLKSADAVSNKRVDDLAKIRQQEDKRPNSAYARPLDSIPVEIRDQIKTKMVKRCPKCHSVKPPRAHHCSTCGRCVLLMDHHCPWMNNCVGLNNQKAFVLFNFYGMVVTGWTAGRVAYNGFQCAGKDGCTDNDQIPFLKMMAIVLVIFCVLFFLFTIIMFFD